MTLSYKQYDMRLKFGLLIASDIITHDVFLIFDPRNIAAKQMINCTHGALFVRCRDHKWAEIEFLTIFIHWFHSFLQCLKYFILSKLDDRKIKVIYFVKGKHFWKRETCLPKHLVCCILYLVCGFPKTFFYKIT